MRNVNQILENKGSGVIAVPREAPVLEVIRLMAENHIGSVLVMQGTDLVGIATERDYARKVILLGRASRDTRVRDVMSAPVQTAAPDDSVATCMARMTEGRLRHLPVLDEGRLVGLVSIGDLVKALIDEQAFEIEQMQGFISGNR